MDVFTISLILLLSFPLFFLAGRKHNWLMFSTGCISVLVALAAVYIGPLEIIERVEKGFATLGANLHRRNVVASLKALNCRELVDTWIRPTLTAPSYDVPHQEAISILKAKMNECEEEVASAIDAGKVGITLVRELIDDKGSSKIIGAVLKFTFRENFARFGELQEYIELLTSFRTRSYTAQLTEVLNNWDSNGHLKNIYQIAFLTDNYDNVIANFFKNLERSNELLQELALSGFTPLPLVKWPGTATNSEIGSQMLVSSNVVEAASTKVQIIAQWLFSYVDPLNSMRTKLIQTRVTPFVLCLKAPPSTERIPCGNDERIANPCKVAELSFLERAESAELEMILDYLKKAGCTFSAKCLSDLQVQIQRSPPWGKFKCQ